MKRLFYLLLLLVTNSYYSCNESPPIQWEFKINNPDSLDLYINDTHIINTSEFGLFYDENTTYAFDVLFSLSSDSDTIYVRCSQLVVDCDEYEYNISKKIVMPESNTLNNKYKLKVKTPIYTKEILVSPQHGSYIVIMNNPEVDWWYQQDDTPFEYGSYPPNRIE